MLYHPFAIPTSSVVVHALLPTEKLCPTAMINLFSDPDYYKGCPTVLKLISSVEKSGVRDPLIVENRGDGKYDVSIGNRRLFAALKTGRHHLWCIVNSTMGQDHIPRGRRLRNSNEVFAVFGKIADTSKLCLEKGKVYAVAEDSPKWS